MSNLVEVIAAFVTAHVQHGARTLPHKSADQRTVFHGPPKGILRPVFDCLTAKGVLLATAENGDEVRFPVLLAEASLPSDAKNPVVGESGQCDASHLLSLRNTPACPQFLALAGPASHSILSVAQATDGFGLRVDGEAGAQDVAAWWQDPFVQFLASHAVEQLWPLAAARREQALKLLERSTRAADAANTHDPQHEAAWDVLSRVLSVKPPVEDGSQQDASALWSMACGFPPCSEGTLDADVQESALDALMAAIVEEGYAPVENRMLEGATGDEVEAIRYCFQQLRQRCEVPLRLADAASHFYAPYQGSAVLEPPAWWQTLTAERLIELLREEPGQKPENGLELRCLNAVSAGLPGLKVSVVGSDADLEVAVAESVAAPVTVALERKGKAAHQHAWTFGLSGGDCAQVTDNGLPSHRDAIRYVATAPGQASASLRVVSVATWEPGVIVSCRTASRIKLPKRTSAKTKTPDWECELLLEGEGRHVLELLLSAGVEVEAAKGLDLSAEPPPSLDATIAAPVEGAVRSVSIEIAATSECQYDVRLLRDGKAEVLRVKIGCGEAPAEGCRSEFERLVRSNRPSDRQRGGLEVQVDRQARLVDLQQWALSPDSARQSFYPVVIAEDSRLNWHKPGWQDAGSTVLSKCEFLHDPRPSVDLMAAPEAFCAARERLAERIRDKEGDGLAETARLGQWTLDAEFAEEVERYLSTYLSWLEADPDVAAWVDLIAVCRVEQGAGTLDPEPDAILVSPLHPVRLAWQCAAQRALYRAIKGGKPCPASSILSSASVPDSLALPIRLPTGAIESVPYLSLESDSDYWGVMWNGKRIASASVGTSRAPFDRELGIRVGGVTTGFSVSQVRRALDDVVVLRSAKPILNVAISSSSGLTDACNEGVVAWARDRFSRDFRPGGTAQLLGVRELRVFDERNDAALPEDAAIANLAEATGGAVSWYKRIQARAQPDIGIVAQLEASSASITGKAEGTPLGIGALVRHRLRSQLAAGSGAFLTESRSALPSPSSGGALEDLVARAVARLENLTNNRIGYTFAPSVKTIQSLFNHSGAEYVAVSSSVVDPACFLGNWLAGTYLWDYELPSYSQRAGDTNGYYLLTQVQSAERDALKSLLSTVKGAGSLTEQQVGALLAEVSRRGVPTIRGLSTGHAGAAGDLGLFVAGRLLQDEFRGGSQGSASLLRVLHVDGDLVEIGLVIPVDPFRGHLQDLNRGAGSEDARRPDFLAVGIRLDGSAVGLRLTPIEVKYRRGELMSATARTAALEQAAALGALLEEVRSTGQQEDMLLWRLAWQHLVISMLDFAFRVYSQQETVATERALWTRLHSRVIEALLHEEASVQVDRRGRLIVCDDHTTSEPTDQDKDGFDETIILSPADIGTIVTGDPSGFYESVRAKVGTWELLPIDGGATDIEGGGASNNLPSSDALDVAHLVLNENPATSMGEPPVAEPEEHGTSAVTADSAVLEDAGETLAEAASPIGMSILIGRTAVSFTPEPQYLRPNLTDLTQLNIGVVGDLGTGKTQLLKSVVHQIAHARKDNQGHRPRILILDYKNDYRAADFVSAAGARVVEPHNLPLNLFDVSSAAAGQVPWMSRFKFLADVLSKIYAGIGPVQRDNLKQAVRLAFEDASEAGRQPTILDVHARYQTLLKGKTDAPMAIIGDMVDMELFARDPKDTMPFGQFLDGVVVLSLGSLGQDDQTKNTVVAIMLNLFYEHMLQVPKRPFVGADPQLRTVDSYLLVDEADNIMRYEFDVLRKILLQGREFGVGVILASQYLSHFKAGATDYREPLLSWAIHRVPNISAQELSSLGLAGDLTLLAERIKQLDKHHCLFKTRGVPGVIVRGTPHYELVSP
jgi:DNA phosphorothioation-dependent restriction protein DptH